MTQPLRAWHRRVVFTLAAALPLLFGAGLAVRKQPAPRNPNLAVRAARAGAPGPDMLVYWSASQPPGNALPPDALLLGSAPPRAPGYLVFYSLAHREVISTSPTGGRR